MTKSPDTELKTYSASDFNIKSISHQLQTHNGKNKNVEIVKKRRTKENIKKHMVKICYGNVLTH